ncbi:MAG: hypothetical protein WBN22_08340 [Verrucomicrobiia bacterium]
MKLNFSKFARRLRFKSLTLLVGLILTPLLVRGTASTANFTGTITTPPQVDATNFFNSGYWDISTINTPYQTANTLNYTNEGTMVGGVGWEFDFGPLPVTGGRGWSSSFFNDSPGTIQAVDGLSFNPYPNLYEVSYLWVSATNIVNQGTLEASANGELVLNGGNVSLALSQLFITSPSQNGGSFSGTNFTLDTGLYSETWAQTNMPANLAGGVSMSLMNSSNLWNGTRVTTPHDLLTDTYGVQDNCSADFLPGPVLSNTIPPAISAFLDTNDIVTTNEVRQAVFVLGNSTVTPHIRFTPSSNQTNLFQTVAVQLAVTLTNAFDLTVETNAIYLVDTLGSETNRGYYVNSNVSSFYACSGPLYQPANYIVSRSDPVLPTGKYAFGSGANGMGTPSATFFYDPSSMPNPSVSNTYSAYSVYVDDLASDPSGAVATNLAGRIRINANNLDLSETWLGAQGDISIQASNLVGSAGAVVDCQNLSFDLGSTSGYLNFTDLAKTNVSRLQGPINAWSALWTNAEVMGTGTNATTNLIGFSILIVDASGLHSQVPVTVHDLALHSTNITISDFMMVDQSLLLDGQSFTLLGSLSLFSPLQSWSSANAPALRYFTNNGALYIPGDAHFGDDTATNYAAFVNNGSINIGSGETINSVYYQDEDTETAVNGFSVTASTGLVENAVISSLQSINFNGGTLQLENATLTAGNQLNFSVTNFLSDNGVPNMFNCNNGFNLLVKPTSGDLLGTTFQTTAPARHTVAHIWAGHDFGPALTGFANNAVIRNLVLVDGATNGGSEPRFIFSGIPGQTNGLYVDYLNISQCTNFLATFRGIPLVTISNNLTIYYANAIGANGTNSAALNGQFGGQLVWVNSANSILSGGGGGGGQNQNPTLSNTSYNDAPGKFQFSIASQSGQTNIILATTNLVTGPWVPVFTNIGSFTFTNFYATNSPAVFFRDEIVP